MFEKLKKLLSPKEKKSLGSYSLLSGPWGAWGWNDGNVTSWEYRKWAYLGYSINPISYRAVNIIADSVAGVPWVLYRKMADNRDVKIEQAPVLDLLKRPNPWMGEKDFFAQFIQYLQLSGNTFVRSAGPNAGPPKELYFLRPERIEILNNDCGDICPDEFGSLIYEYTCGRSKERIDLRHFHHCKHWNPLCDAWGLSPLQPASSSIDLLNEALQWNVSLLKNSCSPSGVLSSENNLSDEQIARLREQMEVKHQGVWNSGKPLLLEGGLSFSAMGLSPKEADWIHAVELATKQIYLCLGIDPSLGGDSKSKTFANYRDGEKNFYTATVIPLLEKIRDDFLNRWLLPRFNMGDNVYFQYDIEAIECLSE
jgi:HK97 family phage portal protein